MEHAPAQCTHEAILRPEPQRENQRTGCLKSQASKNHHALKPHHTVHLIEGQCLRYQHPLPQAHLPTEQKNHQGCRRHEAQAAQLYQTQQHPLAKAAPLGPGVKGSKAGNAGGRGSSEQRRQKLARLTGA